jgi:hypothetical protein
MSIQEVSAEELAKLFHHYQGALSEDFQAVPKEAAPAVLGRGAAG